MKRWVTELEGEDVEGVLSALTEGTAEGLVVGCIIPEVDIDDGVRLVCA